MKILLVGEYNSSHYTLKEGLERLGHTTTVVGLGDGFKKRSVDVNFVKPYTSGTKLFIKRLVYKIFKKDLNSISVKKQFNKHLHLFKGNDIVQLVNEVSFGTVPSVEKELLEFIFRNNRAVFLLSCGTDHISVRYAIDNKFEYSIATPYLQKKGTPAEWLHMTQYLEPEFIKLHQYIFKRIDGVIASDMDYHIPLKDHPKYMGMIPNPIKIDRFKYDLPPIKDKIVIFHGINLNNYYKKGNDLFEEALSLVKKTHAHKIEIVTVRSVPYAKYIESYDRAHILLDQVFAYDQGFNALEAMAKGKVVFTGAEKEFLEFYNLNEDEVAINALPDARKIADKLIMLIDSPLKIVEISKNARAFVEREHDHLKIAQKYFDTWSKALS